jgi:AcrR family transcriptional regulator
VAAEISPGSLYLHISSKEELLWEIVSEVADRLLEVVRLIPQDIASKGRLMMLVEGYVELIESDAAGMLVLWHDARFLERAEWVGEMRAKCQALEAALREIIEGGVRDANSSYACSIGERVLVCKCWSSICKYIVL